MDKTTVSKMIFGAVLLLFTACTQDELAEQGNTLPDGEYPLQIGSVSITAESSEEPWTRVAENETDGMGSHWTGGERIGVRIGDNEETGIYTIKVDDAGNVTVEPETPVYWKNTQTADVTAWYPADRSSVDLGFQLQNNTMTYVLHGTGTGNHQSPVTLKFTHQLAKVRVVAKGTAEVRNISIQHVPRICYIDEGIITGQETLLNDIWMLPVEREGIGTCWEASVGPDAEIKYFSLDGMDCDLTSSVTTQAGALHTITWTVNNEGTTTIDLSNEDCIINDDGTYYFSGTASHAIRVKGGNPEIYLEDAQISVSGGNAIDITGGASPTIHVMGENTVTNNSSTAGAGIYVAQGSTVTITGSSREDKLTATGGGGGAGIGGYYSYNNPSSSCGDIYISNVTIIASGSSSAIGDCASGIGAAGSETVGSINISNAVVYATGTGNINYGAAAIGGGVNNMNFGNKQTEFNITISDSEVHATKGSSYASYIGMAGDRNTSPANYDIISTAQITNSTIYNESGTEITQ
ncbi:fimbrillin family protein [Phocaeicola barnesiae]|uniref:fimbrillin family protein n=1 Tax=Phocaeicola barnesiae TaxID=376804 RepID=UPI0025A372E7|nr:fimbrillin family protein [Phocaeicola barnesiae]MDM8258168.1 fimbrillin family protein [Phocaeicola barnesiae]